MGKIWHIDEPIHGFEIIEDKPLPFGKFYGVIFHPSCGRIKVFRPDDENITWFRDQNACLYARVERLERDIEHEKGRIRAKEDN